MPGGTKASSLELSREQGRGSSGQTDRQVVLREDP
uniref:Uncharacterized protein n=1 Tax=Setaria digitata TaxID=48799 RepID=A0A915PWR6_9BILA